MGGERALGEGEKAARVEKGTLEGEEEGLWGKGKWHQAVYGHGRKNRMAENMQNSPK